VGGDDGRGRDRVVPARGGRRQLQVVLGSPDDHPDAVVQVGIAHLLKKMSGKLRLKKLFKKETLRGRGIKERCFDHPDAVVQVGIAHLIEKL
jgi:hypothetical protein